LGANLSDPPVRIIVGFAPSGGFDIIARLIGQWLSEPTLLVLEWFGQGYYVHANIKLKPICF